jgi:SAM-dependent methyltransferase
MSDWQERITHETAPAIRSEHELRYRVAAPLILAGGPWADLGCGNGLAAAAALGDERPAQAVLVDIEQDAVAAAASALGLPNAGVLAADLTDPADLHRIGEALLALGEGPVVSCFEVIEHLSSFLALLTWATELAREHAATFVLSVPNDAFWSIRNPHHRTSWSEGAFDELRQLLPAEHTLMRQVALSGSAMIDWEDAPTRHELAVAVAVGASATVPTHFIAAFGARHQDLRRAAMAVQTDMGAQRRWERERESNVALAQGMVAEQAAAMRAQEATIAEQRVKLREQTAEFDAWRTYIHELERELGRPLSGASAEDARQPDADAQKGTPLAPGKPAEPPA